MKWVAGVFILLFLQHYIFKSNKTPTNYELLKLDCQTPHLTCLENQTLFLHHSADRKPPPYPGDLPVQNSETLCSRSLNVIQPSSSSAFTSIFWSIFLNVFIHFCICIFWLKQCFKTSIVLKNVVHTKHYLTFVICLFGRYFCFAFTF